jgi:hypothetical protein
MPAKDDDSKKNDANPESQMGPPGPPPPPPPRMGPPPPPISGMGAKPAGQKPSAAAVPIKKAAPAWQTAEINLGNSTNEDINNWIENNLDAKTLKSNESGANANFTAWKAKYTGAAYGPFESLFKHHNLEYTNKTHLDNFYTLEIAILNALKQQLKEFNEDEKTDPETQAAFEKFVLDVQKLNYQKLADSRTQAVKLLERFTETRNLIRLKKEIKSKIEKGGFEEADQAETERTNKLQETIKAIQALQSEKKEIKTQWDKGATLRKDYSEVQKLAANKENLAQIEAIDLQIKLQTEEKKSLQAADMEKLALREVTKTLAQLETIRESIDAITVQLTDAGSDEIDTLKTNLNSHFDELEKIRLKIKTPSAAAQRFLSAAETELAQSSASSGMPVVSDDTKELYANVKTLEEQIKKNKASLELKNLILRNSPKNADALEQKAALMQAIATAELEIQKIKSEISTIEKAAEKAKPAQSINETAERSPQQIVFDAAKATDNIYTYVSGAFSDLLNEARKAEASISKLSASSAVKKELVKEKSDEKFKTERDLYLSGFEIKNTDSKNREAVRNLKGIINVRLDLTPFSKEELTHIAIFTATSDEKLIIYLKAIDNGDLNDLAETLGTYIQSNNSLNFSAILDIAVGRLTRADSMTSPPKTKTFFTENINKTNVSKPNYTYRTYRQVYFKEGMGETPKKEWAMNIGYLNADEKERLAQFLFNQPVNAVGEQALTDKVNETLRSQGACFIDIVDIYKGNLIRKEGDFFEGPSLDNIFIDVDDRRPSGNFDDRESLFKEWSKVRTAEIKRQKEYLAEQKRIERAKEERIEQAKEAAIAILMNSASNDENAPFDTDKFKQAFTSALHEAGPSNADGNQDSTPPLDDIELSPDLLEAAKAVAEARIEKAKEESRTQAEKEAEEQVRTLQIQEAVQEAKSQAYQILGVTPNPEAFNIIFRSKLSDIATDKNLGDISNHPVIKRLSESDLAPAASEISLNESEEIQKNDFDLQPEAGESDPANQSDPEDYSQALHALFGNENQDIENNVALDSEPEALELGDSDESVKSNIRPPSKIEALLNQRGKASGDQNVISKCRNLEAETKGHTEQLRNQKQKVANDPSEEQHQAFLQRIAHLLATDEKLTAGEKGYVYLALLQNLDFQLTPVTVSPVKTFISEEVGSLREMGITLTGMRAANAQTSAVAYLRQTGLSKDFNEISSDISKTASSLQRIERSKESNVLWRHFVRQVNMLGQSSHGYLPQNHPADWARFMAAVRDLHSLAPNPPQQYPALTQAVWNTYSNLKQDLPGKYYLDPDTNKMISEGFDWISFDRAFSPLFPATQQVTIQQSKKGAEETVLSLPERDKDAEKKRDNAITKNLSRRITGSQTGDVLEGYKSKENDIAVTRNVFQRIGRQISGTELSSTRESQIHLIQEVINNLNENTTLSTYEKGQLYYTMLKMMQGELSSESASKLKAFVDDEIAQFNAQVKPTDAKDFHSEMLKPSKLMSYLRQNDFHQRYDNEDGKAAYNQLELFLKTTSNYLSEQQVRKQIWLALDEAKSNLSTAIRKYLPTNHPADWARFEAAFQALKDKAPDSPNQHPELLKQCWETLQKLQQDMPEVESEDGFKWKPILKQLQPLLPMQARLELGLFAKAPLSEEDTVKANERSQKALQFSRSPSNKTKPVINDFLEQHRKSGPASIEKVLKQHAPEADMTSELRLAQSMLDNIHYDASLSADQKIQITYGLLRSINSELKSQPKNVESQDAFLGLLEDFYRRVENNPNVQPSLLNDTRQCQENFIQYIDKHGDKLKAIGKALPKDVINVMGNVTRTLNTAPPRSREDEHKQVNAVIALHHAGPRADQLYQLVANAKVDLNTRQNANLVRKTVDYLNQQPNLSPETKGHILMGVVEQLMEQHAKDKKSELLPVLKQLNASLKDLYLTELKGVKESTFKSFVETAPLSGPAWDRMKHNVETADHKRKGKAGR